jgi:hypothetical protein
MEESDRLSASRCACHEIESSEFMQRFSDVVIREINPARHSFMEGSSRIENA